MHYLGKTDVQCGYCGGLGFQSEIQGTFKDNGLTKVHFGDLCCCRNKVKGIADYKLPKTLSDLYTLQDSESKHFRDNS